MRSAKKQGEAEGEQQGVGGDDDWRRTTALQGSGSSVYLLMIFLTTSNK